MGVQGDSSSTVQMPITNDVGMRSYLSSSPRAQMVGVGEQGELSLQAKQHRAYAHVGRVLEGLSLLKILRMVLSVEVFTK